MPIGFALADGAARLIPPAGHPHAYLALVALPFTVLAGAAMLALFRLPEARERDGRRTGPAAAALRQSIAPAYVLLTLAFGFYVIQSLAFFSFLSAWLASGDSAVILPAGLLALFVPGGNVIASILVAGRSPRYVLFLSAAGFVLGIMGATLAFGSVSPLVATGAAALFALGAGMTASSQFAAIPFLVPHGGSPAIAIGFLSQIGGLATLAGPPLAGFAIETWGYGGLGALLAGVSAVGLGLTLPLLRRPD